MLKNRIIHRNKKNIAIVKVCFQSHISIRKCYLPYGFLLYFCYFLKLLENILQKFCARHCRLEGAQPAIACSKLTIENTRTKCEICSELTIKTPERLQ